MTKHILLLSPQSSLRVVYFLHEGKGRGTSDLITPRAIDNIVARGSLVHIFSNSKGLGPLKYKGCLKKQRLVIRMYCNEMSDCSIRKEDSPFAIYHASI